MRFQCVVYGSCATLHVSYLYIYIYIYMYINMYGRVCRFPRVYLYIDTCVYYTNGHLSWAGIYISFQPMYSKNKYNTTPLSFNALIPKITNFETTAVSICVKFPGGIYYYIVNIYIFIYNICTPYT